MRILIDGYNLMFALGLLGRRLGPDGFRKVRHRFLNDLADALGAVESHQTTVVFDAADPPSHRPSEGRHKGLTILFATGDEDADTRIEHLIAHHSFPKGLTVVSSDLRVRQAAARRGARGMASDDFWDGLQSRKARGRLSGPPPVSAEEKARLQGLSAEESAYWLSAFGDLADAPETRDALRSADFVPTDEELDRIAREVDEEP